MNDEERALIADWVRRLAVALEVCDLQFDPDDVLDLAGSAARSVVRPAAPLTTFVVGYAAGRLVGQGRADDAAAITRASEAALLLLDADDRDSTG